MNKGIHFCKIVPPSNDVKRILSKTDSSRVTNTKSFVFCHIFQTVLARSHACSPLRSQFNDMRKTNNILCGRAIFYGRRGSTEFHDKTGDLF